MLKVIHLLAKSSSESIELSKECISVHLNADLILIRVADLSQEKNIGARSYKVISFPGLWIIHEYIDYEKKVLNGPNTVEVYLMC